jgi:LysR family transcriptional regulator, low CO2-responsive transcriptional regulator
MRDATLKQLRSLAATLERGTIVGAAAQLHVTPPAVAQQLRLLERSVGLPLFERTASGLRATDAGAALLASTARIETELAHCSRSIELMRDGKIGSISFGAVSTAKYFAPQMLAAFWEIHPEVDVKLVIGNREEILRGLAADELDVAIMGRSPAELDLQVCRVGDNPHVLIAAPNHRLVGVDAVARLTLGNERFLVREQGSGTRTLTDQLFNRSGIEPPIAMEITSNETIKQAVMAGLGIALISAHTVAVELAQGRLCTLNVDGLPIIRAWYAVHRRALRFGAAAELFWAFVSAHAADFLPHPPHVDPGSSGSRRW